MDRPLCCQRVRWARQNCSLCGSRGLPCDMDGILQDRERARLVLEGIRLGNKGFYRTLTDFQHRDYSSALGQWMTDDPLGFAAGDSNLYRFVGNEPNNQTDPTGFQTGIYPA